MNKIFKVYDPSSDEDTFIDSWAGVQAELSDPDFDDEYPDAPDDIEDEPIIFEQGAVPLVISFVAIE